MAMTVRYTTINGEVIAEKRNGVRREYVPDPLGSTVALLDNTQTQTDTFSYWPYGEVRTRTGTTQPPFQFVGTQGYFSDGTGRTYVRARYLLTQKSCWLTQDPSGLRRKDMNLYQYAGSKPTVVRDPSGLDWCGLAYGNCCGLQRKSHCDGGIPKTIVDKLRNLPRCQEGIRLLLRNLWHEQTSL